MSETAHWQLIHPSRIPNRWVQLTAGVIAGAHWVVLDHLPDDDHGRLRRLGRYVSCRRGGAPLKLANLTPRLKDLFTMTNLAPIFEGHDDLLGHTPD